MVYATARTGMAKTMSEPTKHHSSDLWSCPVSMKEMYPAQATTS